MIWYCTCIRLQTLETDRQMDIDNPEFYFCFNIDNRYALLWTPNVYRYMLMRIFNAFYFSNAFLMIFNA